MLLVAVRMPAGYYFCFPLAIGGLGFFEYIKEMFALCNWVSSHFRNSIGGLTLLTTLFDLSTTVIV